MIETIDQNADIAERARWLQAFTAQRKVVEQGIHDRLPLAERTRRLRQAEAALPEEGVEDIRHLCAIADLLEDKLIEMLNVALGRATGTLAETHLPPGFQPKQEWEALRHPTCREERRWLFVGGMQEILHHYRDSGLALVAKERKSLLNRLSSDTKRVLLDLNRLDSHLVVSLGLSDADRAQITQFRTAALVVNTLYTAALGSDAGGVNDLLENSNNRFRVQYLATSAQLCLKLYGNVSIFHFRQLWLLKSMYPLLPPEADPAIFLEGLDDSERQRFQRSVAGSINRLSKQAAGDALSIWPILQIYRSDARFGRAFAKKRVTTRQEGLASVAPPTDASGTSWIPNI